MNTHNENFKLDPFLVKRKKEFDDSRKDNYEFVTFEEYKKILKDRKETKRREKNSDRIDTVLRVLKVIYYLFTFPLSVIWKIFFKLPYRPNELLGIFRAAVMFFLICLFEQGIVDNVFGMAYGTEIKEYLGSFLYFLITGIFIANFIFQLMVFGGLSHTSPPPSREQTGFDRGYANIAEALNFREAILNQKSTRGKMEELSKTSFITRENFERLARDPNTKEGIRFLDSMLNQKSTRGKYGLLKEMFGGKKS